MTPIELHHQLSSSGEALTDPTRYRQIMGTLAYLTISQPNMLMQFVLSVSLSVFLGLLTMRLFCVFFATFVVLSHALFFLSLSSWSFMPTPTLTGLVILLIYSPLPTFVSSLALLLSPRRAKCRQQSLFLLLRLSTDPCPPLLGRLYGSVDS